MNGMKEGTGDDPYATSEERDQPEEEDPEVTEQDDPETAEQVRELPYIHRRESVKDGRSQRPIWFREQNEERIPDRISELEDAFDETVYRTDYLEAAIQADLEDVDTESILRRWGYGMR